MCEVASARAVRTVRNSFTPASPAPSAVSVPLGLRAVRSRLRGSQDRVSVLVEWSSIGAQWGSRGLNGESVGWRSGSQGSCPSGCLVCLERGDFAGQVRPE